MLLCSLYFNGENKIKKLIINKIGINIKKKKNRKCINNSVCVCLSVCMLGKGQCFGGDGQRRFLRSNMQRAFLSTPGDLVVEQGTGGKEINKMYGICG